MNIKQYLDSTYLKTAAQANLSEKENTEVVKNCIQEAIDNDFKLIMIRPDKVAMARKMIHEANSKVTIGTVIDFPLGNGTLEAKLAEAKQAIENGVDDLDYVVDYEAFKRGGSCKKCARCIWRILPDEGAGRNFCIGSASCCGRSAGTGILSC